MRNRVTNGLSVAALSILLAAGLRAATPREEAWEASYNLDYDRSLSIYEQLAAANPGDASLHNYVAYTLLYRELLRNGALESQMVTLSNSFVRRVKMEPSAEVERRFFAEISRSISLCEARLASNPRDSATLHVMAVAYGLRANYGFLVRKTWTASLGDSSRAHKYDVQATEIDPGNYDARLIQGVYDYIVGSLPWSMRALGFIAGYRGDKERGLRTLEEVAEKGKENAVDAQVILCALYRREGQAARAIPLILRLIQRFPRNYILHFELAQMYGSAGQRANAIQALDEIAKRKAAHAPGFDRVTWEKIWFETGNLQFWFNDLSNALENLKKVTATDEQLRELDLNTGVLALMRQGQIYDLMNRHDMAVKSYQQAIAFAPDADAAKESKRYISSPYKRPTHG